VRWIEVWNMATGEVVLGRVRRCSTFACRLRGLTFRGCLSDDEGLLLVGQRESCAGAAIHMLFVFFPIAVAWLDAAGRVVDSRLALPFRPLYAPATPARDILEGPPNLLERIRVGDSLRFSEAARG